MADFLDQKRGEIAARLNELRPLVDEYKRLETAAAALDGVPAVSGRPGRPRRQTGHTAAPKPRPRPARTATRRGRPRGSGTRRNDALELVKASPGITVTELAEKMGIKPNYLYRVLPALAQDGLLTKDGRGWHPKQPA